MYEISNKLLLFIANRKPAATLINQNLIFILPGRVTARQP
jgi:hypothetical protein